MRKSFVLISSVYFYAFQMSEKASKEEIKKSKAFKQKPFNYQKYSKTFIIYF